jgi:hypothetical protein
VQACVSTVSTAAISIAYMHANMWCCQYLRYDIRYVQSLIYNHKDPRTYAHMPNTYTRGCSQVDLKIRLRYHLCWSVRTYAYAYATSYELMQPTVARSTSHCIAYACRLQACHTLFTQQERRSCYHPDMSYDISVLCGHSI